MSVTGNVIGLIGSCVCFAVLVWQTVRAHKLEKELEQYRQRDAAENQRN